MFDRIATDPKILGGKPCIKGTRLSVQFILELLAAGGTRTEILSAYPQITTEDLDQALRYAAETLKSDRAFAAEADT